MNRVKAKALATSKACDGRCQALLLKQCVFCGVAGRYHLYISYGCPFASRCLALLHFKACPDPW